MAGAVGDPGSGGGVASVGLTAPAVAATTVVTAFLMTPVRGVEVLVVLDGLVMLDGLVVLVGIVTTESRGVVVVVVAKREPSATSPALASTTTVLDGGAGGDDAMYV